MIWFTSDTHFNDEDILQYIPSPVMIHSGINPSWDKHDIRNQIDNKIIQNWKQMISPNDTVYHLGDVGKFKSVEHARDAIEPLPGRKILIMGNHDTDPQWVETDDYVKFWRKAGFADVYPNTYYLDEFIRLVHIPPQFPTKPYFTIFGHVHNVAMYRTVTDASFCVCTDRHLFRPVSLDYMKLQKALIERQNRQATCCESLFIEDFMVGVSSMIKNIHNTAEKEILNEYKTTEETNNTVVSTESTE